VDHDARQQLAGQQLALIASYGRCLAGFAWSAHDCAGRCEQMERRCIHVTDNNWRDNNWR
jgi:hypothetical protein